MSPRRTVCSIAYGGWPPLGAAATVEGPCLTGQHAGASGGLRPVARSSLPRPEFHYPAAPVPGTGAQIRIGAESMAHDVREPDIRRDRPVFLQAATEPRRGPRG